MRIENIPQNTASSYEKPIQNLKSGDTFTAHIVDIKKGEVTIKFANGDIITAQSTITPSARIGEDMRFIVKGNKDGQITLEMLKDNVDGQGLKTLLDALFASDLYPTKENINILKALMDNRLPIDKKTLQDAAFFFYANNEMDMEKMLFLISERFAASEKSLQQLNAHLHNQSNINEQIMELLNEIEKLPDGTMKESLQDIILSPSKKALQNISMDSVKEEDISNSLPEDILSLTNKDENVMDAFLKSARNQTLSLHSLFLDGKTDIAHLDPYYKKLMEKIDGIKMLSGDNPNMQRVSDAAGKIADNIDFMDHIHRYKQYMQIPFVMGENQNKGDLYIFCGRRNNKKLTESASVLLALDTAYLGHVESYIQKNQQNITFQFRAESESVNKFIKTNMEKLIAPLKAKGFRVASVTYKTMDAPFNIMKEMDGIKEENKNVRYVFDMRV